MLRSCRATSLLSLIERSKSIVSPILNKCTDENLEYVMLYLDQGRCKSLMPTIDVGCITEQDFKEINRVLVQMGETLDPDDPSRGLFDSDASQQFR